MRCIKFGRIAFVVLSVAMVTGSGILAAEAKQPRSSAARNAFVKTQPCPATGLAKLPCHGYVIDHVVPLCAGGLDQPVNMQWQSIQDAKAKDRDERSMCGAKR